MGPTMVCSASHCHLRTSAGRHRCPGPASDGHVRMGGLRICAPLGSRDAALSRPVLWWLETEQRPLRGRDSQETEWRIRGRNARKSLVPSLEGTRGRSINGGVPLTGPLGTCRGVAGLGARGFAKDAPTPLVSTLPRPGEGRWPVLLLTFRSKVRWWSTIVG
jgi:hypothetical protein